MFLFTGTCILCDISSHRKQDLCLKCESGLPWLQKACPRCGLPFKGIYENVHECGQCLQNLMPFDKTIALFYYKKPIDNMITALKFANKLIYAKIFGDLLGEKLQEHYKYNKLPELIIPVPLHKKRLQERGFNQALEITRPIAKKLHLSIDFKSCQRIKYTKPQALISSKERLENIKKAFVVNKKFHAKHVAIIDDVMTTGNTVKELSKALRCQGVRNIDVWCCARTIPNIGL